MKNAYDGSHFSNKDVVFECFHNFVALSQWGNTIFGIMSRLAEDRGDPIARASFQKTMSGNFDKAGGAPFTPSIFEPEHGAAAVEAMRVIKHALDPSNIMNPGGIA